MCADTEDGVILGGDGFVGEDAEVIAEDVGDVLGVKELRLVGGEGEVEDCKLAICSCCGRVNEGLDIYGLLAAFGLFKDENLFFCKDFVTFFRKKRGVHIALHLHNVLEPFKLGELLGGIVCLKHLHLARHIFIEDFDDLFGRELFHKADVQKFAHTLCSDGEGGGEDHLGLGIEALGVPHRKLCADKDLRHCANKVEVGDVLKSAKLFEADS